MSGSTPPPIPDILSIRGLRTVFRRGRGELVAVDDLDLAVAPGETVALVGESGCGKSVTVLSVMGLLPAGLGRIAEGTICFRGRDGQARDLVGLEREAMRRIRGNDIAMVFQEPMTSLNPVYTVGEQIAEPVRVHLAATRTAAGERAVDLLAAVGIPDPERRARQYPHELSGGMRQRATIAMALACNPTLLLADEPTTALDVTIQAQILDLLRRLQLDFGMGILFVTHNLGVVAEIAHRVAVMYAGRIVETGPVGAVFRTPRHPYTVGLLASVPRLGTAAAVRARGGRLATIPGTVPSLGVLPPGCAFADRCPLVMPACRVSPPATVAVEPGHTSRCLRWQEVAR